MVLDDRRMKVREIAETRHFKRTCRIYLAGRIGYEKALCKMGAAFAHADKKRTHVKISQQYLERFNKNKTDFVYQFITMDETWIHHYTPESKQQSEQWTEARCSVPKKTRSVPSAGKVMALVFWDAENIFYIEGKTITGEYYSNFLTRLNEKIREKRPGLQKKKSSFIRTMHPPKKKCFGNGKIKVYAL
jgi:hypothetical protein